MNEKDDFELDTVRLLVEQARNGDMQAKSDLATHVQSYLTMMADRKLNDTLRPNINPSDIVQHTLIRPPQSLIGPADKGACSDLLRKSPFAGKYDRVVDRESAYELLKERAEKAAEAAAQEDRFAHIEKQAKTIKTAAPRPRGRQRQSVGEAMLKSVARSVGSRLGTQIVRAVLGSLFRGR